MISIVPGSCRASGSAETLAAFFVSTRALYSRPEGSGSKDAGQDLHGRELGMRAGGHVIEQADQADVADPAQGDDPLAVLRGLLGVGRGQLAVGPGQ